MSNETLSETHHKICCDYEGLPTMFIFNKNRNININDFRKVLSDSSKLIYSDVVFNSESIIKNRLNDNLIYELQRDFRSVVIGEIENNGQDDKIDESFHNMTEVSYFSPLNPTIGQYYFDLTKNSMFCFDGDLWNKLVE